MKILYIPFLSPPHTCYMPCPFNYFRFYYRKRFGEQYRSRSSSFCRFMHSPVTSSLLGPNILHNNLFSSALSLRSSLNLSDQVLHPYKTTGKIIFLYTLFCKFWIASSILYDYIY
jgi:hypothetical protein